MADPFETQQNQPDEEQPEPTPDKQPPPVDPPDDDDSPDDDSQKTFDADYVKKLRDENAKRRTQLRETEARLAELEKAEKERQKAAEKAQQAELEAQGEYEKVKAQYEAKLAEAEAEKQRLEQERVSFERVVMVARLAEEAGAYNPSDANFERATAEVDPRSDDAADQVKQILEKMKESQAYLFRQAQPTQQNQRQTTNGLTRFDPPGDSSAEKTDAERVLEVQRRSGQGRTIFG